MEANPVWRHKRSLPDEPECYTGNLYTIRLTHTGPIVTYPDCRTVARFTACSSSMANNNNKKKCLKSNIVVDPNGSCAPWTDTQWFYWALFRKYSWESFYTISVFFPGLYQIPPQGLTRSDWEETNPFPGNRDQTVQQIKAWTRQEHRDIWIIDRQILLKTVKFWEYWKLLENYQRQ